MDSSELFSFARRVCCRRTYRKGEVLWHYGSPLESIYFLDRGQVAVTGSGSYCRTSTITIVRPGEMFGVVSLSARERKAANSTAVAEVTSDALSANCEAFVDAMRHRPDLLISLVKVLAGRVIRAQERACVLTYHRAEERVCALLLYLAKWRGHADAAHPGRIRLQFTHDELARLAALTRAHLSVMMAGLRRDGIAQYGRSTGLSVDVAAAARLLQKSSREDLPSESAYRDPELTMADEAAARATFRPWTEQRAGSVPLARDLAAP